MKAIIVLVDGFEEIEAVSIVDVLRRADIEVTICGLVSTVVEGGQNIKILTEKRLNEVNENNYDCLILPGGQGCKKLLNSKKLLSLVRKFNEKKKYVAAICAAPIVLAKAGVIEDKLVTVYPGYEKKVPKPREAKVIIDENIITANGPSNAILFALKIVEKLKNKNKSEQIKKQLVME